MKTEPTEKQKKKKKADLLRNLLGAEKHRHQVATITEEGEWNQHEPNGGMARVFVVMLLLHVFLIGGIILYDFIGTDEGVSQASHSIVSAATTSAAAVAPIASSVNVTPAPTGEWEMYEVKSGDSLPNIAAKLGVDESALVKLNALDGSVSLQPHSWLRVPNEKIAEPAKMATIAALPPLSASAPAIPAAPAAPAAPVEEATPAAPAPEGFKPMDASLPDVAALSAAADAVDQPPVAPQPTATPLTVDTPPPAPVVEKKVAVESPVPRATAVPKPAPVPPPSVAARKPEPAPAPKTEPAVVRKPDATPSKSRSHTVSKGDTLYSMSRKYGVSVSAIQKANNIKDPTSVREGAKLIIPAL